jgi:phosphoglycolate phosphatase
MALVCFDWDGTLADSWPLYEAAVGRYCVANDLYVPNETEMRHSFGNLNWAGIPQWKGGKEDHWAHRTNIYGMLNTLEEEAESYHLISSMNDTIDFCLKQKYKVGVATSRPRVDLLRAMRKSGHEKTFPFYMTGTCAHERGLQDKPAPDMLHCLMEHHSEKPETTIMIGDTVFDMKMANAAKCKSIAVTWGAGKEDDLHALNPSAICSDPSKLGHIIGQLSER